MKRLINIIKSYYLVDASGYNWFYIPVLVFLGIIEILIIGITILEMLDYTKGSKQIQFSNLFTQLFNFMNVSQIFVLNMISDRNINKRKEKNNYNLFLLQLPVNKKDLFNAKFLLFLISASIPLIMTIFLIGVNLFTGNSDYISAYTGFFVAVYIAWLIIFPLGIGFGSLESKRYKFLRTIPLLWFIVIIIVMFTSFHGSVETGSATLNKYNMYCGFGKAFAPIVKACRPIGGIGGIFAVLISIAVSYYLSSILPYKISQKEG